MHPVKVPPIDAENVRKAILMTRGGKICQSENRSLSLEVFLSLFDTVRQMPWPETNRYCLSVKTNYRQGNHTNACVDVITSVRSLDVCTRYEGGCYSLVLVIHRVYEEQYWRTNSIASRSINHFEFCYLG